MSTTTTEVDQPELKRVMGPRLLLLFIVGDILGAGVYAVTGEMALEVGGIVWLPFLIAFVVATLTAYSYLELVTKYPQAAGAALYTHQAFGLHFVTFLVAFAVVCSGITSASTSSNLLATNLLVGLDGIGVHVPQGEGAITLTAMLFMLLLGLINLRGVGESVRCLVLRRDPAPDHAFRAPTWVPAVGAVACAFLVGPWARDSEDWVQYTIAGGLLAVGVVLWALTWALTWATNRGVRAKRTGFRDIDHLEE